MENTIATRIYDFLKGYPPFDLLGKSQLMALAERAIVQYCTPDEVITRQGADLHAHIYIVREGEVRLYNEGEPERVLVEKCDEGDLFGIQALITDEPYVLTAIASEESLIYGLPVKMLRELVETHPKLAFYLARSYASDYLRYLPKAYDQQVIADRATDNDLTLVEIQTIEPARSPVTCSGEKSIRTAAEIMSREEVSSIIVVNASQHPVGIVTDKDLRKQVATGKVSLETPIADIMSSPVITVSPRLTVADVQIQMVKHGIHHLCITEDGSDQSPVVGVLSEHDLLVIQANNPAVLIRNARRSKSVKDLRRIRERAELLLEKYIHREVDIDYISTIMTEINDALVRRSIELSEAEMDAEGHPKPSAAYCWLALGSGGREEQLLRTDQDNALVFSNVPEAKYEATKNYYLQLAAKITGKLNECGFDYCPADMMASNPKWCLSLAQWKRQFSKWIHEPTNEAILYCTIFFDYRTIYGDASLSAELTEHIFTELNERTIFLPFLAKNALQNPPPLTFFRDFMVERSGEHKDEFDIKSRAMMPLTDAARVLVLDTRVGKINNTFRRFAKLAEMEPQNRELYEQAAEAYELLMRYRTIQGLKNKNSGRFFKPSELTKMERLNLRNSFRPIRELQSLLNIRFQLAYFR